MKLDECIKRIDRYMHSSDNHPRLVNVQNCEDMKAIYNHFRVDLQIKVNPPKSEFTDNSYDKKSA